MNDPKEIIEKILESKSYVDIFPEEFGWKDLFKEYAKLIYPDICKLDGSKEATQKLLRYKTELENGKEHEDDAGKVIYFRDKIILEGDENLLKTSYDNYCKLKSLAGKSNFKNYLPEPYILKNGILTVGLNYGRAIPLSTLPQLPQEHLNWILSRMLEFSAWMCKVGFTHIGINPDSMVVVPKNHAVMPITFYHMKAITARIKTVSGRYYNFYPQRCLIDKEAKSYIDVELSKRTVITLSGDKSGAGLGLLSKGYNKEFVNFVSKFHTEHPVQVFKEYRELLKRNFKAKFYALNV